MKYFLFLGSFALSISTYAQQGQLFPNEIRSSYQWNKNQNYHRNTLATAEVFVRIQDLGKYRIFIGDQSIENTSGLYRFFDLASGKQTLSIYEGKQLIYRTSIYPKNNHRLILDYNHFDGLFLLDEVYLSNQIYTFPPISQNGFHQRARGANPNEFQKFFEQYRKTPFSDDKLKLFKSRNISSAFTSEQIVKLIKELSFDKEKMIIAKEAFRNCIDPENYYQVIEMFDFNSSKRELEDFIKQHYQ